MAEKHEKHSSASKDEQEEKELVVKDTTQTSDSAPTEPVEETQETSGDFKQVTPTEEEPTPAPESNKTKKAKPARKFWTRGRVIIASVVGVLLIAGVLMAVPVTRYGILGTVVKRDVTITLHDSKTNKPVSSATVTIGNATATTDAKGVAVLKAIPVGDQKITIHKKYFQDTNYTQLVDLFGNNPSFDLNVVATGRQVQVKVINKVSQQPVENAQVTADGTSSKTDKDGLATLVLPADKATMDGTVTKDGYNQLSASVTITEQTDPKNTFSIVPAGKVYFLSKRTGKIDVMKSNVDGSDAQTVLAGTGNESDYGTVLLASSDWKYLALIASRDSDKQKLYLIDTTKGDKLSTIDEGDATFNVKGWSGSTMVFMVFRTQGNFWDPGRSAIKSYNAQTNKLTVLDQTDGVTDQFNHAYEGYNNGIYVLNNVVLFVKAWYSQYSFTNILAGRSNTISSVQLDGQNKKVLKNIDLNWGVSSRWATPQEVYFEANFYNNAINTTQYAHFDYVGGNFKDLDISSSEFNKSSSTFFLSPSGDHSFWSDARDGKYALFVGDKSAGNAQQIASGSDYRAYGWLNEDYLLVSKNDSELYVISRLNPSAPALKITDYHKPQYNMGGGGGYGAN